MLQGRRFFRPFDLETRGVRRVLHPFAGAISVFGFAIAVGTFLWNDVIIDQAKERVSALDSGEEPGILAGDQRFRRYRSSEHRRQEAWSNNRS